MARLTGFDGIIGSYDKTHIPQLGVDRFVEPGQGPYAVYDAPLGRIGLQTCYDWRFPRGDPLARPSGRRAGRHAHLLAVVLTGVG